MNRPGANHLDRRRRLTPRDYIPLGFGVLPGARCHTPAGGDHVSAAVARIQHELVLHYRGVREHGDGRRYARAFGVSETVWTRCLGGERFMGETVMAALLCAISGW
ncbi:hypothetical protein [Modestobacter sp. KNN46-3]|uniref:hypothetical protein n=1 Tax=Modestobacter sp. KNN46-3 TaxID=2711218 RepID=UPI0013E0E209|nr:hypothetical protein [Modestobacter sp. KNN46-3]